MMEPIEVMCGAARRAALLGGPRRGDDALAVHVARCARCQAFIAGEQALARAIAEAAPAPPAPPEVRARVFRAVALEHRTRRRSRWLAVGAAAAATLLLTIGLVRTAPGNEAEVIATTLVDDFIRLQGRDGIRTSERRQAEQWLAVRADVGVTAPGWTGAALTGARICPMPSGNGAVLEYLVAGTEVGYYVLPARGEGRDQFAITTIRGYSVVAWRTGDLWHAAVSRLPPTTLQHLVQPAIAPPESSSMHTDGPQSVIHQARITPGGMTATRVS